MILKIDLGASCIPDLAAYLREQVLERLGPMSCASDLRFIRAKAAMLHRLLRKLTEDIEGLPEPEPQITIEELVKLVARYLADNTERESRWLTSDPQWSMKDPAGLLDLLSEETGIDKKTIAAWVDERHLENEQNE